MHLNLNAYNLTEKAETLVEMTKNRTKERHMSSKNCVSFVCTLRNVRPIISAVKHVGEHQ
jgi:hypothetical protein